MPNHLIFHGEQSYYGSVQPIGIIAARNSLFAASCTVYISQLSDGEVAHPIIWLLYLRWCSCSCVCRGMTRERRVPKTSPNPASLKRPRHDDSYPRHRHRDDGRTSRCSRSDVSDPPKPAPRPSLSHRGKDRLVVFISLFSCACQLVVAI